MTGMIYRGQRVALLTQHGKEKVLAPVLDGALGCRTERVTGYDTDLLGTFSRNIPRFGTQLDAARKKARLGMGMSGVSLGLASEGSFGPDPFTGMLPWNLELLIFIDDHLGLEVLGRAHGKANYAHQWAADWAEVEAFANQIGFPAHQLVMRPKTEDDPRIRKDICTWAELETAFASARQQSINGRVFLEVDGRAHANPTRMENIRLAAEDLVTKLASMCPVCGTPGFWIVELVAGLPCADCSAPTRETLAEVHGCLKCAYRHSHEVTDRPHAAASRCDYCNP